MKTALLLSKQSFNNETPLPRHQSWLSHRGKKARSLHSLNTPILHTLFIKVSRYASHAFLLVWNKTIRKMDCNQTTPVLCFDKFLRIFLTERKHNMQKKSPLSVRSEAAWIIPTCSCLLNCPSVRLSCRFTRLLRFTFWKEAFVIWFFLHLISR